MSDDFDFDAPVSREELAQRLSDRGFRRAYLRHTLTVGIARQIVALRHARGWTQQELADRAATTQETISLYESGTYGNYSISTLKKVAAAFGCALIVRFESWDAFVDDVADVSSEALAPPSFGQEIGHADAGRSGAAHE